jgi:hypothetical protein
VTTIPQHVGAPAMPVVAAMATRSDVAELVCVVEPHPRSFGTVRAYLGPDGTWHAHAGHYGLTWHAAMRDLIARWEGPGHE